MSVMHNSLQLNQGHLNKKFAGSHHLEGLLKLNFDASVVKSPLSIGLGVVVRNNKRDILAWSRRRIPFTQEPKLAEAFAVRLAAQLAIQLHARQVTIEGDCSSIIRILQSSSVYLSSAGYLLRKFIVYVRFFRIYPFVLFLNLEIL